jgi:hypothetical protein
MTGFVLQGAAVKHGVASAHEAKSCDEPFQAHLCCTSPLSKHHWLCRYARALGQATVLCCARGLRSDSLAPLLASTMDFIFGSSLLPPFSSSLLA